MPGEHAIQSWMGGGGGGEPPQEDGWHGADSGTMYGNACCLSEGFTVLETPHDGRQGREDAQRDGEMDDHRVESTQPGNESWNRTSCSVIMAARAVVVTTVAVRGRLGGQGRVQYLRGHRSVLSVTVGCYLCWGRKGGRLRLGLGLGQVRGILLGIRRELAYASGTAQTDDLPIPGRLKGRVDRFLGQDRTHPVHGFGGSSNGYHS